VSLLCACAITYNICFPPRLALSLPSLLSPGPLRSQLCATAQLILDPFYRTIRGFATLIEKDWCSFGHMFATRCGHGTEGAKSERSPVFLQWLDVVAQMLLQFPTCFEFGDHLLVFLSIHAFSGLFGTFLGDCEWDRTTPPHNVRQNTVSVWSYVLKHAHSFTSPAYQHYGDPIWPSSSLKQLVLWKRYFCRSDASLHPPQGSGENRGWEDDYGIRDAKSRAVGAL
jgi:myotubularin-related protein 1/2